MRRIWLLMIFAPLALHAQEDGREDAQTTPTFQKAPEGVIYSESEPEYIEEIIRVEKPESRSEPRPIARLRGLDKISGRVTDIRVEVGGVVIYERLRIAVDECRAPPVEEGEDAYAFLRVTDEKKGEAAVFSGWMFASSPALSAMDHPRYDLWVLSCTMS